MVTLDRASKTLTLGSASDINHLTNSEQLNGQRIACFQLGDFVSGYTELNETETSFNTCFSKVTGFRFVNAISLLGAKRNLHSCVAVSFGRFDLRDAIGRQIQHRHRDGSTILSEDAGHADFATD